VRARITALTTLVSGAALVIGAVLLLVTLDHSLHRTADGLARSRVLDLAVLARQDALPRTLGVGGEDVAQVFTDDGTVLAGSSNITGADAITSPASSARPKMRVLHDAPDDNETENYRVWTARYPTPRGPVTVVAGSSLESVGEASRTLRRDLMVGVPLLVLLVAAGTWLVVGRTLRPVEDIRRRVASITDEDLGQRVPVPASGDEVSRLATTMNQMLERLQESSRRQREFVADASHELQSPVTSLRTQLEVALAREGNDWPETARLLLQDTDEMDRLVHDLLFLARTSDGVAVPRCELLDLDDVVLDEVTRVRGTTDVELVTSEVSAAPVTGDADELRRLVRNLLENAVRHARSVVRVRLGTTAGAVHLEVADDGPGVAPKDRERIFDRFVALHDARSRGTGSGLGLAIARDVATRHDATLRVCDSDLGGAGFRLRLPEQASEVQLPSTSRSIDATTSATASRAERR
jgi:signal transduction histidine kinase